LYIDKLHIMFHDLRKPLKIIIWIGKTIQANQTSYTSRIRIRYALFFPVLISEPRLERDKCLLFYS